MAFALLERAKQPPSQWELLIAEFAGYQSKLGRLSRIFAVRTSIRGQPHYFLIVDRRPIKAGNQLELIEAALTAAERMAKQLCPKRVRLFDLLRKFFTRKGD